MNGKLKCKYNKLHHHYIMGDWIIQGRGGFCTIRTFSAKNEKTGYWFWQSRLKDVKEWIEKIEADSTVFEELGSLYKKPLYNA